VQVVLVGDASGSRYSLLIVKGTIAIGYGVVADIAHSAERGSYVGALACGQVPLCVWLSHFEADMR
jgi:hypothetical protein